MRQANIFLPQKQNQREFVIKLFLKKYLKNRDFTSIGMEKCTCKSDQFLAEFAKGKTEHLCTATLCCKRKSDKVISTLI